LLAALVLFGATLISVWRGIGQIPDPTATSAFLSAGSTGLCSLLLLPSAWHALRRLQGKPAAVRADQGRPHPLVVLALTGAGCLVALGVGYLVSQDGQFSWWALPPLQILAIGLPVYGVFYLGRYGLPGSSPQRAWGVFGVGLTLGPVLMIVVEVLIMIAFLVAAAVYVAIQPDLAQEITNLAKQLEYLDPLSEEALLLLSPYLLRPEVSLAAIFFAAGVVPLVEELLKPIGVWFLLRRKLTPAEGFVAGLLSGAAFALVESLGNTSSGGETWAVMALARSGTGVMHILASGLVGWGLASACTHRRYLRLVGAYLAAVTLHGLWNALAVTAVGMSLLVVTGGDLALAGVVAMIALLGMAMLTLSGLAALAWVSWRLRQTQPAPAERVAP
jgi:hypothetical protein